MRPIQTLEAWNKEFFVKQGLILTFINPLSQMILPNICDQIAALKFSRGKQSLKSLKWIDDNQDKRDSP